jgi:CHAD domain-containing protein
MGAERHTEVERKYLVDDRTRVPLAGGPAGATWEGVENLELEAVYFDTAGLDLLRRGITLRRRTGGADAGWHLKVPGPHGARTELRRPLGRAVRTVPARVAEPVRAVVRDRPLLPVATLVTRRTEYGLVSSAGRLATLCDDRVSGTALVGDGDTVAWREWELEVAEGVPAPEALLESVGPSLEAAGARPAHEFSKVHRVLGATPEAPCPHPDPHDTAAVLRARLQEQVAVLHEQDAALRSGDPAAVHRMRIAARRLRAALTTCRPVLARPTDEVRSELRWLGQVLGPVRDTQVLRERIRTSLTALPGDLVMGPVRRRLDVEMRRSERDASAAAGAAISSGRYYRLLDALDDLVAELELVPDAAAPASDVLGRLVRRDVKRLRRAVRATRHAQAPAHDAALHEARKKAKRLRYAAELASATGSRGARKLARRSKRLQELLGQHQDTVMARRALRGLGAQAFLEGENGFTFGLLHGLEQSRALQLQAEFETAWRRVPGPRRAGHWVAKG